MESGTRNGLFECQCSRLPRALATHVVCEILADLREQFFDEFVCRACRNGVVVDVLPTRHLIVTNAAVEDFIRRRLHAIEVDPRHQIVLDVEENAAVQVEHVVTQDVRRHFELLRRQTSLVERVSLRVGPMILIPQRPVASVKDLDVRAPTGRRDDRGR